jgi:hypothetical protein
MVPVDSDRISHVPPYSGYCYLINNFRVRDYHPYCQTFQFVPLTIYQDIAVLQPRMCRNTHGLGCFHFARHYYGNHSCFLFLRLLRCFSSARSPPYGCMIFNHAGFPIQKSRDQNVFATPPSLSQLITSFFASQSLGIPRVPLVTYSSLYYLLSSLLLQSIPICQRTCLSKKYKT